MFHQLKLYKDLGEKPSDAQISRAIGSIINNSKDWNGGRTKRSKKFDEKENDKHES